MGTLPDGKTIEPTGEHVFWDNAEYMNQLGRVKSA